MGHVPWCTELTRTNTNISYVHLSVERPMTIRRVCVQGEAGGNEDYRLRVGLTDSHGGTWGGGGGG